MKALLILGLSAVSGAQAADVILDGSNGRVVRILNIDINGTL